MTKPHHRLIIERITLVVDAPTMVGEIKAARFYYRNAMRSYFYTRLQAAAAGRESKYLHYKGRTFYERDSLKL